jgi:ABC-2 type transport system ATP-binding protein
MIRVENLGRQFGDFKAVNGITFEVSDGEIFGFLGPNGAGKTTTVRMLSCVIKPSTGNAFLDGLNIRDNPLEIRKNVGLLTENPCLYEKLTSVANLDFFGKLYDVPNEFRPQRINEILEMFDLYDRKDDKVGTFSKGMKQKLSIARALLHNPKVVFLDEPTSALDPKTAKGIRDYIKKLGESGNHIVFICTHNLTEAEYLCDRVAVINHGKIVGVGSPNELRKSLWKGERIEIALKNYNETLEQALKDLNVVKAYIYEEPYLKVDIDDSTIANPLIISSLVNAGAQIITVEVVKQSLEEVYLNLIRD